MSRIRRRVLQPRFTSTRGGRAWALGALAAVLIAQAAAAEPLTIERALDLARRQNPEILAARQEAEIARGRLVKARYWNQFNPEIEGGAAQRHFDSGGTDVQPMAGASEEGMKQ